MLVNDVLATFWVNQFLLLQSSLMVSYTLGLIKTSGPLPAFMANPPNILAYGKDEFIQKSTEWASNHQMYLKKKYWGGTGRDFCLLVRVNLVILETYPTENYF